ncbi:hypothetical protein AB205_0199610 [Aquarana catesbeiana]|uniref:Uncharacterized protein n=1 Tax=Aquarana catesbeiana TaxID=8400 RepID=A0A2G9SKN0_AQUCT|nr:hypothetical protein AB205_0199610 [Aquarana catesbeiana]
MAEIQQVRAESSNDKESPEQGSSTSWRRYKASNMSFVEMVEMVDILKRTDYDGNHEPYRNPNVRKAKIMTKDVRSLHRNFGVRRFKEQLSKRWSDLKLREHDQYRRMRKVVQKREKRIGTSEDTRSPTPPEKGELSTQPEDVDAEVQEVVEMVTTTGDVDVVEEETHFNSASAQVLISETMVCIRDLEKVKQNINDVQKRLTNITDVLAKI